MTKTKKKTDTKEIAPTYKVEGISEYNFQNGLKVLLFPDLSQDTFTLNITYLVGSRHEGIGECGMAHLLEHMLFKGTKKYPDTKGVLEDKGAIFNASTWLDRTNYYEILPSSKENLDFAIAFEADRMINSKVEKKDLDSEMTVVRNEFEMGENNPMHVLHDQVFSAAYNWHNYGRSTIGNKSDIERVPIEKLKLFYKYHYQPDNAVLTLAGNFVAKEALELIIQYFASIKKPTRILETTYTEEPAQEGARKVLVRRPGDIAIACSAYHIPSGYHEDMAPLLVLVDILTQEPSGRLYKSLVEKKLASSVFGSAYELAEPGMLTVFAKIKKVKQAKYVAKKMIKDLENFSLSSISNEEVERVKIKELKYIKLALADSKKVAMHLTEYIAQGDWKLFFFSRDRLKDVTIKDVKRVAAKYIVKSNRTSGLFIPSKLKDFIAVPKSPSLIKLLKNYKGEKELPLGEVFDASPLNIEKHTNYNKAKSSIKYAILSKQTRAKIVRLNMIFRFGNKEDLNGLSCAISLIPALMLRGTKNKNYQAIQDHIDKLGSTLDLYGGIGGFGASIISDSTNIYKTIDLLKEICQEVDFNKEEFLLVKNQRISALKEKLQDPMSLGLNSLERLKNPWSKSSIHNVKTIEEKIKHLETTSLKVIKETYKNFFGASNLEFSIVGWCNENKVRDHILCNFENWKSPSNFLRIIKPYKEIKHLSKNIFTPGKKMSIVAMATNFKMQDNADDYPAMHIAHYIFGESMKSRLWYKLREKGGLSYNVGSSLDVSKHDKRAEMSMFAMCANENIIKAADMIQNEFYEWVAKGISEKELIEAKKSYLLTFKNYLASDSFVAQALLENLDVLRNFKYYKIFLDKTEKLRINEVNSVLYKYLSEAKLAKVLAGDIKNYV